MAEKRYPFSMIREGHNIELAYNHLKILVYEMEEGNREYDQKTVDSLDELSDLYERAIGCPVYWATGEEYGKLKEASLWAECYRDQCNAIRKTALQRSK